MSFDRSESTAGWPGEYLNERGDVRYQPAAYDRLLWATDIGSVWSSSGSTYGTFGPRLYRSKDRAIRIGRRRERHLDRKVFVLSDHRVE